MLLGIYVAAKMERSEPNKQEFRSLLPTMRNGSQCSISTWNSGENDGDVLMDGLRSKTIPLAV
jgi:hypothetical protein